MSGHTPGEWTAREGTTTGAEVVAKKPRGGDYVVARCAGKDRVANADLVAAAPALLAALKALLAAETVSVHVGYDNAAGGGNFLYADAVRTDDEAFALARAAIARAEDSHV